MLALHPGWDPVHINEPSMEVEQVQIFKDAMLDKIQKVHVDSIRLTKPASSHAFDIIQNSGTQTS